MNTRLSSTFLTLALAGLSAWAQPTPILQLSRHQDRLVASYSLPADAVGTLLQSSSVQSTNWTPVTTVGLQATAGELELTPAAASSFYRLAVVPRPNASKWAWIPPGRYLMGSPDDELDRVADEGPQHEVEISLGFWMGRCEVTQSEYTAALGLPAPVPGTEQIPISYISWNEAMLYCQTLNKTLAGHLPPGFTCRLPTEEEWEYAARAGSTTRYSFGDDLYGLELNDYAWWQGDANKAMPVGLKRANPWGLYDMHGNLFEWCMDYYLAYPGGSIPEYDTQHHMSRGGSNYCPARYLRSASRHHFPMERSSLVGFRVVVAPQLSASRVPAIVSPRR